MAKRVRAPGKRSLILRKLNAELRDINAEIRALERLLIHAPSIAAHGPILRRLDRVLSRRETALRKWAEVALPEAAEKGARYAVGVLGTAYRTNYVLRRVLKQIQAETFDEIARSTRFIRRDVKRLIRQIVKETTELHVKRGLSIPQSRRLIAKRLDSIGLKAFRDRSGRRWSINAYSQMLARTRTAQAYNIGTVTQSLGEGTEFFEVFDGINDELCAPWNGEIVSARWALEHFIAHPNCQRAFGPVPGYSGKVAA